MEEQQRGLTPKEQWDNHLDEIHFPGWLQCEPRPILWIGGKQNRRGASWVSSFSKDVIEALELEKNIDLAYIIFNGGSDQERLTPLTIFKRVLVQLLQAHPEIVLASNNLNLLSVQAFQHAGTRTETVYEMLKHLLGMIERQPSHENQEIFLIIDRIDLCLEDETAQSRSRFLKSLLKLNMTFRSLRVVLTSQYPAPTLEGVEHGKEQIMEVWVDTSRPSAMESC